MEFLPAVAALTDTTVTHQGESHALLAARVSTAYVELPTTPPAVPRAQVRDIRRAVARAARVPATSTLILTGNALHALQTVVPIV